VDIGEPDVGTAVKFYSSLFGWESQDMGEEAGHYTIASKAGKMVAGIGPAQDPGPPHWTMYINVDDVDQVAASVESAGGKVLVAPMEVMTAGRMAVFSDLTGAVFSAWQPRDHRGAQVAGEAATMAWCELATSDMSQAKLFYSEVFGWGWGGAESYAEAQVGGRSVAGVQNRPEGLPAAVPDHWLIYFGTDDVDADTQKAADLGGAVLVPPTDIPGTGRFSVVADPQGAAFGLYKG
jgi:predicted enzyme related to lactoylglutathione lyase